VRARTDDSRLRARESRAANTLLGVQARRPSFYDLTAEMARMDVPTLIMSGDEEEPCLEVNLLMKRAIPSAALAILPASGHAINLEEPALFNQLLESFFHQVETGRWRPRGVPHPTTWLTRRSPAPGTCRWHTTRPWRTTPSTSRSTST
jgi:hypothetical protein